MKRILALSVLLTGCSLLQTPERFARYMETSGEAIKAPYSQREIRSYADSLGLPKSSVFFIDTNYLPNLSMYRPSVKFYNSKGHLLNFRACNANFPGYLEEVLENRIGYSWLKSETLENELECIDTSLTSAPDIESADYYVIYYWRMYENRFNRVHLGSLMQEIEDLKGDKEIKLYTINIDNRADWGWSKEEYIRKTTERRTEEYIKPHVWVLKN